MISYVPCLSIQIIELLIVISVCDSFFIGDGPFSNKFIP